MTLVLTEEQKLVLSTQRRNSTSDQNSSEISLMKSNSVTSGNSVSDEIVISRSEWDSLQCELDKLRALMGLGKFFIMSTEFYKNSITKIALVFSRDLLNGQK